MVSYVLNRPTLAEEQLIDASLDRVLLVLPKILDGDFAAAMNELHTV